MLMVQTVRHNLSVLSPLTLFIVIVSVGKAAMRHLLSVDAGVCQLWLPAG